LDAASGAAERLKIPHGTIAVGDANTIAIVLCIMLYDRFLCRGKNYDKL